MRNRKVYLGATLGLVFGAVALAPVLPMPLGAANVYAVEGTGIEVSNYGDFYDAIVNGDQAVVTLTGDITEVTQAVTVATERTVTIDLNGHTLTVRKGKNRGIINYGNLTITGGGVLQNSESGAENNTVGIIDNYGTLNINNVTLKEYGNNKGSSIRNNANNAVTYFNAGAKLQVLSTGNGNVGISATKGTVYIADGTEITSTATTYYPLQVKDGTMTIGTLDSANPAVVRGIGASMYVYSNGRVIINNIDINSEKRQAIRVNSVGARVEINGGKFTAPYGGVYIYNKVTGTEPLVTINDGEFSGEWASVVSTNTAGDLEKWAFNIKGGVYAGTRIRDYLSDSYKAYRVAGHFDNGWAGYFVEPAATENIPTTIYIKKGTQSSLNLSATAKKYATVTLDKEGVIVLDQGDITSGKTGIVTITTDLNDGSDPIKTIVYSYENLLSVELVGPERFSANDVAALDGRLGASEKKLGYLDISLARIIDGVEFDRLSESEEPMTILVEVPEIPALAEGYKRAYRVIYYHNGEPKEITDITLNEEAKTLGFETKAFTSPFLVTYTDTEIPEEDEPTEPENHEDPNHPIVPKDNTFDFDDPGELDPLGETFTKAADKKNVGVPNTSNVANSSEINLLAAMMIGATTMTGLVLAVRKRQQN